jgi:hypothetical protein
MTYACSQPPHTGFTRRNSARRCGRGKGGWAEKGSCGEGYHPNGQPWSPLAIAGQKCLPGPVARPVARVEFVRLL